MIGLCFTLEEERPNNFGEWRGEPAHKYKAWNLIQLLGVGGAAPRINVRGEG